MAINFRQEAVGVSLLDILMERKVGIFFFYLETHEFFVSRDVVFSESNFPFSLESTLGTLNDADDEGIPLWAPIAEGIIHENLNPSYGPQSSCQAVFEIGSTSKSIWPTDNIAEDRSPVLEPESENKESRGHDTTPIAQTQAEDELPNNEEKPMGRGHRKKIPSVTLKNIVVKTKTAKTNLVEIKSANPPSKVIYPLSDNDLVNIFSETHIAYVTAISETKEPKSFRQAMVDEHWRNSMGIEVVALEENQS